MKTLKSHATILLGLSLVMLALGIPATIGSRAMAAEGEDQNEALSVSDDGWQGWEGSCFKSNKPTCFHNERTSCSAGTWTACQRK